VVDIGASAPEQMDVARREHSPAFRRVVSRAVGRACGSGAALPRPEGLSSEIQKPPLASRRLQLLQPQVMAAFATALVVSGVLSFLGALFIRTFRLARKDFRLLLLVLFSFSLLGFVTGQIMGQSREPAVMGVLPAVLTLLGGIAIYLVGAKGLQTQALVAAMVSCFALALLTGVHFGGRLRVDFEIQNAAYLDNQRHAVELQAEDHRFVVETQRLQRYVDFLKLRQDFAEKEKLDLTRFDTIYEKRPSDK
jgi:hypothetical protein